MKTFNARKTLLVYIKECLERSEKREIKLAQSIVKNTGIRLPLVLKILRDEQYPGSLTNIYRVARFLGFKGQQIQFQLLEALVEHPEISRADISAATGLTEVEISKALNGRIVTRQQLEILSRFLGVKCSLEKEFSREHHFHRPRFAGNPPCKRALKVIEKKGLDFPEVARAARLYTYQLVKIFERPNPPTAAILSRLAEAIGEEPDFFWFEEPAQIPSEKPEFSLEERVERIEKILNLKPVVDSIVIPKGKKMEVCRALAERLGYSVSQVKRALGDGKEVKKEITARVREVYNQESFKPKYEALKAANGISSRQLVLEVGKVATSTREICRASDPLKGKLAEALETTTHYLFNSSVPPVPGGSLESRVRRLELVAEKLQ